MQVQLIVNVKVQEQLVKVLMAVVETQEVVTQVVQVVVLLVLVHMVHIETLQQ